MILRVVVRSQHSGDPIPDVAVRVYSDDALVAYGYTETDGLVEFDLSSGVYEIRVAKKGCASERFFINLDADSISEVELDDQMQEVSDDGRFCRVYGTLLDGHGSPVSESYINFSIHTATWSDAVIGGNVSVKTDEKGRFVVDLPHGPIHIYHARDPFIERVMLVPTSSSLPFSDLIAPYIKDIIVDDSVTVPSGAQTFVDVNVMLSNNLLGSDFSSLNYDMSQFLAFYHDDGVEVVPSFQDWSLRIIGGDPGSYNIMIVGLNPFDRADAPNIVASVQVEVT